MSLTILEHWVSGVIDRVSLRLAHFSERKVLKSHFSKRLYEVVRFNSCEGKGGLRPFTLTSTAVSGTPGLRTELGTGWHWGEAGAGQAENRAGGCPALPVGNPSSSD